jgi:hypothetical protein
LLDGLQHAVGVQQDLMIPESDDAPALLLQPRRPELIIPALGMLAAIGLNDKPTPDTREVDDVPANRMLATEFEALQPTIS